MSGPNVKIIVVDDHPVFRESLCRLIGDQSDMMVVGQAGDGREAVELARDMHADVILLDITMPELGGVPAIQRIQDVCDARVVILSMHTSERMILEAMGMGAAAYLTKRSTSDEIIAGIRSVMDGRTYLSSDIDDSELRMRIAAFTSHKRLSEYLSPREKEVLQLIAEGRSTRDIAATLKLSVHTVNRHRVRVMDKLGMRTVAELTRYAIREGLSSID